MRSLFFCFALALMVFVCGPARAACPDLPLKLSPADASVGVGPDWLEFGRFSSRETRYAARIEMPPADWSDCDVLSLALTNPDQDSLYLGLLLRDSSGKTALWHEILPLGPHTLRVPLRELGIGSPAGGEIFIRRPGLFEGDPPRTVRLGLQDLRLEQRPLRIEAAELGAMPAVPGRMLLQARASLPADWELTLRDREGTTILSERFLRHNAPRWVLPLTGRPAQEGPYRLTLQASRGAVSVRHEQMLDPARIPYLEFFAWAQASSRRPDAYAVSLPPDSGRIERLPELLLAGDERESLILPMIAGGPLGLDVSVSAPGLKIRLWRVGWLQAWTPQELYRIGAPGWIADPLLPLGEGRDQLSVPGFAPAPGRVEALYLELQPAKPETRIHVLTDHAVEVRMRWHDLDDSVQGPRAQPLREQRIKGRVRSFALPGWRRKLPKTAFSIYPQNFDYLYGSQAAWRWAEANELMRDHDLHPSNLYQTVRTPEQIDALLRLSGKDAWINLGYLGPGLLAERLSALRTAYAHLKAIGRLHQAYVFAFDEHTGPPDEPRAVFATLDRELPGLPVISTARLWDQPGDWPANLHWSPALRDFDLYANLNRQADWGYVFIGQRPPYPNFLLESRLAESRIVPWLGWRLGLEGLLYYTVNRWSASQGQIKAADLPLLPWQPNCFQDTNGDGCLIYPGEYGPLPSLRLKQLQQGFEDWALLKVLADGKGQAAAEAIAARLVRSPKDYETDPDAISAAARALREALLACGEACHAQR